MEEYKKAPSYTYDTPDSERLWKLFDQRVNIQRTRRAHDSMLNICYPGSTSPLQDLEERVRKLEQQQK